ERSPERADPATTLPARSNAHRSHDQRVCAVTNAWPAVSHWSRENLRDLATFLGTAPGPCQLVFPAQGAHRNVWRVPPSSAPISREWPATSAARMAARRRVWLILSRQPPTAGPTGTVRDVRHSAEG